MGHVNDEKFLGLLKFLGFLAFQHREQHPAPILLTVRGALWEGSAERGILC